MCSYDRAGRFSVPKQATLPKVCPNTYYLPDAITKHRDGYAPFLSYASRQDRTADKRDAALPSAADYFPRYPGKRPKGGNSLWYTEPRFKYKVPEGPSPGDYDIKSPREIAEERKSEPIKGKGKLYQCRVPYSMGDSPPSIPHRTNCHGYVVGKHNALTANPPSFHDVTRGPAFYAAEKCCEFTCDRYKGNQWSKYTSKRNLGVGKEGPGPADYDIGVVHPNPAREQDELIRFYKRKCSKQPRLLEIIEQNLKRENLPGPGHYNIPYIGKKKKKRGNFAFLTSSQRFKYNPSGTPAPGTYDVKTGLCQPKPGSLKPTPFLQDALRFPKEKPDNLPGPATYNVPGMADMLQQKLASRYATRVAGFNSCTERDLDFAPKDAKLRPAPNAYDPQLTKCIQCPATCTSVFKSRTKRLTSLTDNGQANCATYSIEEAYKHANNRVSHRKPRDPRLSKFDSTNPRFGPVQSTHRAAKIDDPCAPGPADYAPTNINMRSTTAGGEIGMAKRFVYKANGLPGPGAYKMHPRFENTLTRGTFNSTLGNPLPHCLINVKPWLLNAGAKKLTWFERAKPKKDKFLLDIS